MTDDTGEITRLLGLWRAGDRDAGSALVERIYPELRRLAQARLQRQGAALTLRATELAHEAFERLQQQSAVDWHGRAHFFAIAATVIRRVAIDYLRQRHSDKRGGGLPLVRLADLAAEDLPAFDPNIDWLAIDQALTELECEEPDCARVVELKFFSGLTTAQIAAVQAVSVSTIERQWRYARAWLADRLGAE